MSKLIVSLPYLSTMPHGGLAPSSNTLYTFALAKDGLNDDSEKVKSGTVSLSDLPKADATVLVVPARALSWHKIDLPKVPKAKLRAALDGLLEEHLLDDTSDLAFALSPDVQAGKATAGAWVAACDKTWLNNAVITFESAGCRVTQVVPEFWPQSLPRIGITGTNDDAWITRADNDGVMTVPLHLGDTSGVLQTLLSNLPVDTNAGAEPAVMELAQASLLPYTNVRVQLRPHATGLLFSASSNWELAQFEQGLSGDSQGMKSAVRTWQAFWQTSAWRPARWGLVALVLANIIGLNAWAWQQQASLSKKRSQLSMVLTQTFPNVKTVVDPALQMSREMTVLRQATGTNSVHNFESMLSAFSSKKTDLSIAINAPNAIEYIANNGNFSINFKNMKLATTELTTAQEKLKPMGYTLTQNGDTTSLKIQAAP